VRELHLQAAGLALPCVAFAGTQAGKAAEHGPALHGGGLQALPDSNTTVPPRRVSTCRKARRAG
jgi:hypothetical protein